MTASWSPQQREWLAALGYVVHAAAPAPSLPDDPLLQALLRAARCAPDDARARRLVRDWPSTASLRRDPEAKRRLWPSLRALRVGQRG